MYRATDYLNDLVMDPLPLFGDELTELDTDEVTEELMKAINTCNKLTRGVFAAIVQHIRKDLCGYIADEVQKMVNHGDGDWQEVDWEPTEAFMGDIMTEAHGRLREDGFERMLRALCSCWCDSVEDILNVTAQAFCVSTTFAAAVRSIRCNYSYYY